MNEKPVVLFSVVGAERVDVENGVIYGVSVVTVGPALGHYVYTSDGGQIPVYVDGETLRQVKSCSEKYSGGLKVKLTHGGEVGDIVGALKEFSIQGTKLLADLHVLRSYERRGYILEIAQTMPESFGLSISFSGEKELKDGKALARCVEIYSADLVDSPAANPGGLFSKHQTSFKMDESTKKEIGDIIASTLKANSEEFSKASRAPVDELVTKLEAKIAGAIDAAVDRAIKGFTDKFGQPPVSPAPNAPKETPKGDEAKDKFEDVVRKKASECGSKFEAISFCQDKHPELYADYLARVTAGEVIDL